MANTERKEVVIKCELKWAHLGKVNDKSNRYQVDCIKLDKKQQQAIKAIGLEGSLREGAKKKNPDPEAGIFITPKANVMVPVMDSKLKHLPIKALKEIGNGTVAMVAIHAYPAPKSEAGVACGLSEVQILDLVPYEGRKSAFQVQEDGYTQGADFSKEPAGAADGNPENWD